MLQKEGLKIMVLFLSWLLYQTTQREGSTTTFEGKRKVKTGARKLLPLSGLFQLIRSWLHSHGINIFFNKLARQPGCRVLSLTIGVCKERGRHSRCTNALVFLLRSKHWFGIRS